ncbi:MULTISPECIES: fibronectin type III domain-containing protein [unclassified Enterococcus]|jgi:chitodextrinase|uniref:fibronectin type III domain-containing protein n=1 Tax=unclassified Enterococcus TaxID=2608891 RepID=UPI003D2A578D
MKKNILKKVVAASMVCVSLGGPVIEVAATTSTQQLVTVSDKVLDEFPIKNGDFNDGLEHWIVSSPGTNNPELVKEGDNQYAKATQGENIHQYLNLEPNKTYKFVYDVAGSKDFPAKVEFGTLNHGEGFISLQESEHTNEEWERNEFSFSAPDAENTYIIRFSSTGDGWAKFDNIKVYVEDTEAPTAPKNLKASDITETSVKLDWEASADNVGVTGYQIFRDGKKIETVNGSTLTFTDSGLKGKTTYKYTAKAIDEANNISEVSNEVSVTTQAAPDKEAPTVPQNLRLTGVRENKELGNEIDIAWDASSDNEGVVAYNIYLNKQLLTTVDGNETSYTRKRAGYNTRHLFRVSAVDAAGNESELSNTETGMVQQQQSFFLYASDLLDSSIISAFVQVGYGGYTASESDLGRKSLNNWIQRIYVPAYGYIELFDEVKYQGEEYFITNNDSFGRYYNLESFKNKASSYKVSRTLGAENVKTKEVGEKSVELTWTAPRAEIKVKEYSIYRDGKRIGKVDSGTTSFIDKDLDAKTTYTYMISAVDTSSNPLKNSEELSVTTKEPADAEAPTAPPIVESAALEGNTLRVQWNYSKDNVGVVGYIVYRDGKEVGRTTRTHLIHVEKDLPVGKEYTYTVKAFDAAGNISPASTPVKLKTDARLKHQAPTIPTNLKATKAEEKNVSLTWSPSTDNASKFHYRIYRDGKILVTLDERFTSYTDRTAKGNTTYTYTIEAIDRVENLSERSTPLTVTTR